VSITKPKTQGSYRSGQVLATRPSFGSCTVLRSDDVCVLFCGQWNHFSTCGKIKERTRKIRSSREERIILEQVQTPQPIKDQLLKVKPRKKPKWIAPEVIQTSAMDCGPASLKSLLEGFGISVSYGRLREACQTDVDGTSIDTMEEIAVQLGLNAEQTVIPVDHLFLKPSNTLPAIVVIRQPNGSTHFLVAWRNVGGFVQVMDPATGRRWMSLDKFTEDLYIHTAVVPSEAWHGWSKEEEFLSCLRERVLHLTKDKLRVEHLLNQAKNEENWMVMAALDAATRMTASIVEAGGIDRGQQAAKVLESFWVQGIEEEANLPKEYWSARPAPAAEDGTEQTYLTGAVLVRILGPQTDEEFEVATTLDTEAPDEDLAPQEDTTPPLSAELERALREPPTRPWREIFSFLRQDGFLAPTVLTIALFASSIGLTIEALLLRGFLDVSAKLQLPEQRLGAMAIFLLFALALLLLEIPLSLGFLRIGRRLETRLRVAFLEKLPKLGDRYFRSRLTSDMTDRIHSVHQLKGFPQLGSNLVRSCFELLLTTGGLIWLSPSSAPLALSVAAVSIIMPLFSQSFLTERDLKVRSHGGAISRFYLDALLGLVAVRTHGAERALRREHEGLLVEWGQASVARLRASTAIEAVQAVLSLGLSAIMLMEHLESGGQIGGALLLFYWSLALPGLGQEITQTARQYPMYRNVTLRLLEPLGAPEESESDALLAKETPLDDSSNDATTLPDALIRFDSGAFRTAFSALGEEAARTKTRLTAIKHLPHPDSTNTEGRSLPLQKLPSGRFPSVSRLPAVLPAIEAPTLQPVPVEASHPENTGAVDHPDTLQPAPQDTPTAVDPLLSAIAAHPRKAFEFPPALRLDDLAPAAMAPAGVEIRMKNVTVRAGGHTILRGIDLSIAPKSHIAVVGSSGAGKSSLVGLLLGWFKPSAGRVYIDDELLLGARLEKLRQETAWVDPAVQLWNRSILDNLCYGNQVASTLPIGHILEQADLRQVLERFPEGLKTSLGEGGALVSGGEGQRVRFGRALARPDIRLAILDEPFRGLDREKRRELLTRARLFWSMATLLCITHDVGETLAFERVLVIEGGRIVEDGVPGDLASQPSSRYRALLDAEDEVRQKLWSASNWRKIRVAQGIVTEVTSKRGGTHEP
jgi:ABC-type bacteriocin/lantibiotic exporter with double-glycine peptidase domain